MPAAWPFRAAPRAPPTGLDSDSSSAASILALLDSAIAGVGAVLAFLLVSIFVPLSILLPVAYPGVALIVVGVVGACMVFVIRMQGSFERTGPRFGPFSTAMRRGR